MIDNYIKVLLNYLKKYRIDIFTCMTIVTINNFISIFILYCFKIIVDKYIPNESLTSIYKISVLILIVLIVNLMLYRSRLGVLGKVSNGIQYMIREGIFNHVQKIRYEHFGKKRFGELNTNIVQDVESLGNALFQRIVNSLTQVVYFLITFIILFRINAFLSTILYSFILIIMLLILRLKKVMSEYYSNFAKARTNMNLAVNDITSGIKVISVYNVGDKFQERLESYNLEYIKKWLVTNIFGPTIQSTIEFATLVTYVLTFIIGSKWIKSNNLTIGGLLLFLSYLPQVWSRFSAITDIFSGLLDAKVYMRRVFDSILNETVENRSIDDRHVVQNPEAKRSLIFDKVTFSYDKSTYILKDFSLSIESPGLYCIVGRSGAGKSTLFELLLGFFELSSGDIYINHLNANSYSLDGLRDIIGIVHQEIFLMNGTVMGNIRFGNENITDHEIIETSKKLGLHKYILRMNDGYNTIINDGGNNLSSGQRRMITILRIICRNPQIILFDEITSNIDSYSEKLIHSFLKELSKTKICLFITHKKEDLLFADRIINLEDLRI